MNRLHRDLESPVAFVLGISTPLWISEAFSRARPHGAWESIAPLPLLKKTLVKRHASSPFLGFPNVSSKLRQRTGVVHRPASHTSMKSWPPFFSFFFFCSSCCHGAECTMYCTPLPSLGDLCASSWNGSRVVDHLELQDSIVWCKDVQYSRKGSTAYLNIHVHAACTYPP